MGDSIKVDASAAGFDEGDLEAIRESIASVLSELCDSIALHAHIDGKSDLARNIEAQATELGWVAIGLSEKQGGFGFGVHGVQLLHRELGLVAAPGSFLANGVAAQVLAEAGGESQVAADWLTRLAAGEAQAAIGAVIDSAVTRSGDTLEGRVTLLGSADAGMALVAVGQDAALVELDGRDVAVLDFWDRTRTLLTIDLAGVTPIAWLGADGYGALLRTFAIAVAADSIGLARGVADKTIAYMKERVQFGRPIGSFQALKHRAVDLMSRIGIAEHTLAQAVEVAAGADDTANMWARLAKAAATEAAVFVAGDCVQLHGGVGFTWEFDVHLFLKRARLDEMLVADNLAMRDAAARKLAAITRAGVSALELPAL